MSDPSYALQKAVYDALTGSSELVAFIGTVKVGTINTAKVFHRVPDGTPLPYVHIGQDQIIADEDSLGVFSDCYATIHVFSATMPELKQIVGKVRAALAVDLPLVGFNVQMGRLVDVIYRTDEDGNSQIEHAVMTFNYIAQTV